LYNLFVAAVITGDILPFGKVIEKTIGKAASAALGRGKLVRENPGRAEEN